MTEKRPPTIQELLKEVATTSTAGSDAGGPDIDAAEARQVVAQKADDNAALDRQLRYSKLKAFNDHHYNKGLWSKFIMWVMGGMIFFQSLLLMKVGTRQWDFSDYDYLLPILLVQNLAQIITLAAIIVKALFDRHKD